MKDAEWFHKQILSVAATPQPGYGGNVILAMEIYAEIDSHDERHAYQKALEIMLRSDDYKEREYAVNLCLGFFVFRDALKIDRDS